MAPGFSGAVTPSHADYIFLPASRSYNSLTADQISQHYEAVPLYTISGNVGIGGATVTYTYSDNFRRHLPAQRQLFLPGARHLGTKPGGER